MTKTVTEINAERIEGIICRYDWKNPRDLARKIVEAFPMLQQQAQYTSERDGTSRTIVPPLPWPWSWPGG